MALPLLLIAHGVAHLVGFVVPWRLMASPDMPYSTTILAGTIDIGDAGVRALGVVWLMAGLAFVMLGGATLAGWSVRSPLFVALALSMVLCALGWPNARIGVFVNLAILGLLLVIRDYATTTA